MHAHVIAFARHQMIATASLIDLAGALRLARRVGDTQSANLFSGEINRRLSE